MKKLLITISIIGMALSANQQFTKQADLALEKSSNDEIKIQMNSNADVYGIQFDMIYNADEITINDISHVNNEMDVHYRIKSPGLARVIMFDLGGQTILDANSLQDIINVNYTSTNENKSAKSSVTITNIVAAGKAGEEVLMKEKEVTFEFEANNEFFAYETEIVGNYPNPFNPTTKIEFNLDTPGHVDVTIFDLQGRKVANLYSGMLEQKNGHVFTWDASNIASGQYFVRITAPGYSDVHNMTLLK